MTLKRIWIKKHCKDNDIKEFRKRNMAKDNDTEKNLDKETLQNIIKSKRI